MALDTASPLPHPNYSALFRRFLANSLRFLVADVQGRVTLPAEQRAEGLKSLDYALAESEFWADACALLLALAPHMLRAGMRAEWEPYIERGLALTPDSETAAELAYHLGELAHYQGRFADAEAHFAESTSSFARLGLRQKEARSLNRLAYVLRLRQRQPEAQRQATHALSLLEKTDPEWAYSHFVLGVIAFDRGDAQSAADLLSTALAGWEAGGDDEHRADGLVNLAPALRRLGRYDEAIECLEEARHLYALRRDPRRLGLVHLNLGNIHLSRTDWEEALAHCHAAEPLFRQVGDELHAAINFNNMGVACRRLGQLERAERAFLLAIAAFEQMDQPRHHINALDGLGNTYRDWGRYAEAAQSYRQALNRMDQAPDPAPLQSLAAEVQEHLAGLPQTGAYAPV